jgi:hypothetical protein
MRLSRRSGASDGITTDFIPPSKRVHKELITQYKYVTEPRMRCVISGK